MHLLWRRYSRSGYAPAWFYALMAAGFIALVVWAAVARDWLVAAVAAAMIIATIAGARVMRRLGDAADASTRLHATKDSHHER
jgi:hypothetical protein